MSVGRSLAFAALAVGMLLAGCSSSQTADDATPTSSTLLSPEGYADMLEAGDRYVINVHTPDEGSIAGTDLAIAFDQLEAREAELPAERSTKLAIYCMSGNMSATAAETLAAMGYLSLIHISEPTRRTPISYAVFCLKKKKKDIQFVSD